jgi:hypothetical protein
MQGRLSDLLLVYTDQARVFWQQPGMVRLQEHPDRCQDVGENDGWASHA